MLQLKRLTCHDFYKTTSREWSPCERFLNGVVLGFASFTYYVGVFTVFGLAFLIDSLESFAVNIYLHWSVNSHDEKPLFQGLNPVRKMRYGDHPREYLYHISPNENLGVRKTLVYFHGGGFIAANAGVLLQSLTGFCRQGFDIYVANYSRDPFPGGIISTLKVLNFVRKNEGVTEIGVFGDSAGGNLAIQATICVQNPDLLFRIVKIANKFDLHVLEFPKIKVCASICGLVDRTAITDRRLTSIYYIENLFMLLMCKFSVWMYESQLSHEDCGDWGVNIPFSHIKRIPPTRLVAGRQDPLIASSWVVFKKFQEAGLPVEFKTYYGRHIFFGFPTWGLFGNWKVAAQPCLYDLCDLFHTYLLPSTAPSC